MPRITLHSRVLQAGILALVLALLFHETLAGRALYERDVFFQWWGQTESFIRVVARGSWPLWNPWGAFGQPMLANANMQAAYPPTWLSLLLSAPTFYTVSVLAHLMLGAAGMLLCAEHLGLGRSAALVAALLWTACGPVLSLTTLWNHQAAAAWLPWTFLGCASVLEGRSRWAIVWGGAIAAQVLAGSPDVAVFSVLVTGGMTLAYVDWKRPLAAASWPYPRAVAAAAALTVLLPAVQWIPSFELTQRSSRRDWGSHEGTFWSAHPGLLPQLVAPLPLHHLPLAPAVRKEFLEGREPYLGSHYLGLVALGLLAAGLLGGPRRHRRTLAVVAVASCVYSLGRHTPLYEVTIAAVPPLRLLRFPSKALVLTAFSWALLAGMGYDTLRSGLGGRRRAALLGLLGVAVAGASVAAWLTGPGAGWLAPRLLAASALLSASAVLAAIHAGLVAALALGVAALAALLFLEPSRAALALGVLAAIDLVGAHLALNPTAPNDLFGGLPRLLMHRPEARRVRSYVYDYPHFPLKSRQHLGRDGPGLLAVRGLRRELVWPVAARDYGHPPLLPAFGAESSFDFDLLGLHPPYQVRLARYLRDMEGRPAHLRLLQVGGVSYVVSLHEIPGLRLEAVDHGLFPQPIRLWSVPDALPRHYAVSGVRAADDGNVHLVLADPAFDPRRSVALEGPPAREPDPTFSSTVTEIERRPDGVVLDAQLSADGYVVLLDAWDPGWRATMDGAARPVLRANSVFRAVPVPAGRHRVELIYRPLSVGVGLALSALGVLLAVGWGKRTRRAAPVLDSTVRDRAGPMLARIERG